MPMARPTYKAIVEDSPIAAYVKLPSCMQDPEFDQQLIEVCLQQGRSADCMTIVVKLGAVVAKWFYPKHDSELQIALRTFAAQAFTIDDLGSTFPKALRNYGASLVSERPSDAPVTQALLEHVQEALGERYGTWDVHMMFKAVLEVFSTKMMETEKAGQRKRNDGSPNLAK